MHSDAYLTLREDALLALKEYRLLDALAAIEGQLAYMGSWKLKQQLGEIRQDYRMLLTYLKQGVEDPSRAEQRRLFLRQAFELSEAIHREFTLQHSHQHRAELWRRHKQKEEAPSLFETLKGKADYRLLFETAWTSEAWSESECEAADALVNDEGVDETLKATFLSAVTLRLISSFDGRQVKWLLSLLQRDLSALLYDRALVGMTFAVVSHQNFGRSSASSSETVEKEEHSPLDFYPDLKDTLQHLAKEERFRTRMILLQKALLAALEAPLYAKRMEEEIVPEILKQTAHLPKLEGMNFEEMERALSENPHLQEAQSALMGRMSDFIEMQQRGVDATFSSFRHIVRRLPFFNVAANWFCPFSFSHPEFSATKIKRPLWENALKNKICDTDRFALMKFLDLADNAVTEQEQKATRDYIEGQNTPAVSFEVVDETGNRKIDEGDGLRSYIHDCFRFFKLFVHRNEQEDPFRRNLFLPDYSVFSSLFTEHKVLLDMAGFCFRLKHHARVEQLMHHIPDSVLSLALQAYNYEVQDKEEEAVEAYEKLLLLNDSEKHIRRFADCLWKFGRYEDALVHLIRLEIEHPDEIELLLRVGECFLLVELYADAAERFRKVEYLHPDHPRAARQLAWCLMMQRDFAAAASIYDRLLSITPVDTDYFNAAHNAWLSGDVPAAATLYGEYLAKTNMVFAPKDFFDECKSYLLGLGLSEEDFLVMIDLLNCGL